MGTGDVITLKGAYLGRTMRGHGFILVYRLAIDAEPKRCDDVAGRKYPSLLEDFQTGTASMARKRHLASTARGSFGFCLASNIRKLISTDERDSPRIQVQQLQV